MDQLYLMGCDKKNVSVQRHVEFHLLDVQFPSKPNQTELTKVILLRIFTENGYVEVYLDPDDAPALGAWFAQAAITFDEGEIEDALQGAAD